MKFLEKITNRLNDLLAKTYDAEKGYQLAQDKVTDTTIKRFLGDKVQRRYQFGHDLRNEILKYGELKDTGGSRKGDLHRNWMKLTTMFSDDDTERILEEIQRGEEESLNEFSEFLEEFELNLPPSTIELITKQRDAIEAGIQEARKFEELVS